MIKSDMDLAYAALNREGVRLASVALRFHHEAATVGELIEAAARFGLAWEVLGPPAPPEKAS